MKRYLIVVDMQNDFVTGPLGSPEAKAIIPNIIEKIKSLKYDMGDKLFFTKDTHFNDYLTTTEGKKLPIPHCIEGTEGWNIIPELIAAIPIRCYCRFINKPAFGSLDLTWLIDEDDEIDEDTIIELCGVCTDICVISNALMLKSVWHENHFEVYANCCAGTTPEKHNEALSIMESCQIEVIR